MGKIRALLENLPAEIRRHILSLLSFPTLRALVHASPILHQQYILDRKYLLCESLELTLGGYIIDALTVHQTYSIFTAAPRTKEGIVNILEIYQNRCLESGSIKDELDEDDAIEMAFFYSAVVQPLMQRYFQWAQDGFAAASEKDTGGDSSLSNSEEGRLTRALYRFQLFCNLFGKGSRERRWGLRDYDFDDLEILVIFIFIFEPWEVEELACIHEFAKDKFDEVFRDIYWDVNQQNPKFSDQKRPPTPDGAFDFDNEMIRNMYVLGTVTRGLELLRSTFSVSDQERLVSMMQQNITMGRFSLDDEEVLRVETQDWWHMQTPIALRERDLKNDNRASMPFEGDAAPKPPLAWTLIWRNTYSNRYGGYIPKQLRRWGYIMWDANRLKDWGATKVLLEQWENWCLDSDPRDWY